MARGLVAAVLAALFMAPSALAGGPSMSVGAVEDSGKQADAGAAKAKYDLARLAGFDSVRLTAMWSKGMTAPTAGELTGLTNAADAARLTGIKTIVAIHNVGSAQTPLTDAERTQFVQYAQAVVQALPAGTEVVVGNEPNSNYYWMPQFNADGTDASGAAYERLLAETYDGIKAVQPGARVVGGSLAPRGGDNPGGTKPAHSPTSFIRAMGAAYKASGRTTPIMDAFDMHIYEDAADLPPSMEHPNTTTIAVADYGKLVALLGEAFDGTAQAGSSLPIVYGEFGVETLIPAAKAGIYTGTENQVSVDEATAAAYYREAMKVVYCQPNVTGLMLFHVSDEPALTGWQSGPYYADDTAKSSLPAIRDAMSTLHAGTLTSCPDATAPSVSLTSAALGTTVGAGPVQLAATASDDVGVGKLSFLVDGKVVATKYKPTAYSYSWTPAASGTYTLTAQATDAGRNVGSSAPVTITVDITPPETTITAPAAGATTDSPTFEFAASEAGTTFQCALDAGTFAACTSPARYTALAAGAHTFAVKAADSLGNVDATPATYAWTAVDTTPPDTGLTATTSGKDASFTFTATEPGTFECSLDAAPWSTCTSPTAYTGLPDGTHSFSARAIDVAGNADPSPASKSWTIRTGPPNDAFANAQPVATGASTSGTNVGATKEPGEPYHAGNAGGRSIWYRWTATRTGSVEIKTAGSSFDTTLGVYRGATVSALARVASNDDYVNLTSRVAFWATAGVTYLIAVDGYNGAAGSVVLSVR